MALFDFENAVWSHGTCRLDRNVTVRLWHSNCGRDTYRVFLYWQDEPGKPRLTVYSRYMHALDDGRARLAVWPVIRRWLSKCGNPPPGIGQDAWRSVKTLFGVSTENPAVRRGKE